MKISDKTEQAMHHAQALRIAERKFSVRSSYYDLREKKLLFQDQGLAKELWEQDKRYVQVLRKLDELLAQKSWEQDEWYLQKLRKYYKKCRQDLGEDLKKIDSLSISEDESFTYSAKTGSPMDLLSGSAEPLLKKFFEGYQEFKDIHELPTIVLGLAIFCREECSKQKMLEIAAEFYDIDQYEVYPSKLRAVVDELFCAILINLGKPNPENCRDQLAEMLPAKDPDGRVECLTKKIHMAKMDKVLVMVRSRNICELPKESDTWVTRLKRLFDCTELGLSVFRIELGDFFTGIMLPWKHRLGFSHPVTRPDDIAQFIAEMRASNAAALAEEVSTYLMPAESESRDIFLEQADRLQPSRYLSNDADTSPHADAKVGAVTGTCASVNAQIIFLELILKKCFPHYFHGATLKQRQHSATADPKHSMFREPASQSHIMDPVAHHKLTLS